MPSWKKVIISGSAAELSSLYAPSITGSLQGTSSFAVTASYAQTSSISDATTLTQLLVINQTGVTINKGVVVRISGSNNASDIPRITTASYETDGVSANTIGIASNNITNGSQGYVITEGVLTGIDTTGWPSGTLLFLGATGSITASAPQAPLHAVRLGQVIREQNNNGSIHIRVDNGYELGELHDITDTTTTASFGDLLVKSGSVWINSNQLTGSYALTGSLIVTGSTSSDLIRITQTGTGNALVVEDSDNPDVTPVVITGAGNVGIGTTTPTQKLDISGSVNINETSSYRQAGQNVIYIAKGTDTWYASIIGGAGAGTSGISRQTVYGYLAGAVSTGSRTTAVGYAAGYLNSGSFQTAIGYAAGNLNSGSSQTAVGHAAGNQNSGASQTAMGDGAGQFNSGSAQTAIGAGAGQSNTATLQTVVGSSAGYQNTGINQTAIGVTSGYQNSGSNQTAVGYNAGYRNSGSLQTVFGANAGYLNIGSNQTAIGGYAGRFTTGSEQTAVGTYAGQYNSGSNQTAVGYGAGAYNSGSAQTAVGLQAGQYNAAANQTAVGVNAGYLNIARDQTAIGISAGQRNSGSAQTAVGYGAGLNNSGSSVTQVGFGAGQSNLGEYQTAFGVQAGFQNSGSDQTAVGYFAGAYNSGSDNTNIGYTAGYYITGTSGTINSQSAQSVFLGSQTTAGGANRTNQIVIGFNAQGIGSNSVVLGNSSILTTALRGFVGIGITTPTASLHINNTTTSASFLVEDSANPDTTPFVINNAGSVGIGTDTPTAKLHVSGSTILSGSVTASANVNFTGLTNSSTPNVIYIDTASGALSYASIGAGSSVNIGNSDLTITSNAFRVLSHSGTSRFTISGSTSNALLELNNTTTGNSRIISMREQLNGESNRNSVRNFTAGGNNADDSQHSRWASDHLAEFVSGSAVAINRLRGWKWSYYTEDPSPIYKDILLISTSNEATLNASLGITGSITIGYGLNTNLDPYGFVYGTGSYLNGTSTYSAILGGESNRIHTQGTGNVILGGLSNSITGSGSGGGHFDSVIIGGSLNRIDASNPANGEVIAASYSSSIRDGERVSIIASDESTITNGYNIALIGTYQSTTSGTPLNTAIIGGINNRLGSIRRSVILGGSQITASADDTVYMPNAVITGSAYLTGTTEGSYGNIIVIDTGSGQLYYTTSSAVGGGSSTPTFPYTGSAIITGSLTVTGSIYGTELINTTNQYGDITNITPALMSVESNDGANAIIQKVAYTNTTGIDYTPVVTKYYPRDVSYTARGSNSLSYNQLVSGNILNAREHWGYDGIQYGIGFHEYTMAIGTWDNSSHPTAWRLQLTPSGSTTLVQRMEIDETGIITLTSDDIRFDTLPNQTADSIVYIESGSGRISYGSINSLSSGNAFPYTGSAQITGSLGITGSLSIGQSLNASATATANIGSTTIYSVSTSSYDGAWFEYTVRSGSNARAGQIMSIWSGSVVNFTETTTTDFGSTAGLSLGVFIVNGAMALTASAATNGWNIKTIVRSI